MNIITIIPLLLIVAVFFKADITSASIELIYPSPSAWTDRGDHLVFKLNGLDFNSVKVTINGVDSEKFPVGNPDYRRAFQDFVILKPLWDDGKNSLVIEAFEEGKPVVKLESDIFFRKNADSAPPPPEFSQKSLMHIDSLEIKCIACHSMNPTVEEVNRKTGKSNPCYGCHKSIINKPFIHGPVGTFSCAYCHSLRSEPKYLTPKRDSELCGECHVELMNKIKGWKLRHGPLEVGMCEICHDPHGSEYPGLTKISINTLCLSCHEAVAKGIHVVRATNNEGHPLSGKPDVNPNRQGLELACVSCHNPHGGDYRYYFVNNQAGRMSLCQFCHRK